MLRCSSQSITWRQSETFEILVSSPLHRHAETDVHTHTQRHIYTEIDTHTHIRVFADSAERYTTEVNTHDLLSNDLKEKRISRF